HVAKEMQRLDFRIPLMIGGATTSKAHTAVKIEPRYSNDAVVYVTDASRSVSVATKLISDTQKDEYVASIKAEYEEVRVRRSQREPAQVSVPYPEAVKRGLQLDFSGYAPPKPSFTGLKVFDDYPLDELLDYIDWTPFFISWELVGKYP